MPGYTTQDIRNIALVGHAAAGKTMLAERILFTTGTINSMGDVTRGTTVADHDPQEKSHQRSLNSAVARSMVLGSVSRSMVVAPMQRAAAKTIGSIAAR